MLSRKNESMDLSEADQILVNAFHDDELDAKSRKEFRLRLDREPALQRALREVAEVSGALRSLRPTTIQNIPEATVKKPARLAKVLLAAAAVFAAAFVASTVVLKQTGDTASYDPADWHNQFVANNYPRRRAGTPPVAETWFGALPDLSSARLTLVDAAGEAGNEMYLHYSGINGCRLTLGVHRTEPATPATGDGLLVTKWTANDLYYSLIAVGMDPNRFRAITDLLMETGENGGPGDEMMLAVREATQTAVPCA